jgi:alpha-1,6-mannosyltransferase
VASLSRPINLLGAAALCAYAAMALLSYVQAPILWGRPETPRAVAFFESLQRELETVPLYSSFRALTSGVIAGNPDVIVSYWIPLAVASIAMVLLLVLLGRQRGLANAATAALLIRWSIAFAIVCSFSFPVFTQDFWLSLAWGRMIVGGVNPYHAYFTLESLAGLPLDHFPIIMSYGPLWALVSGAVMAISGGSAVAGAVLFKLVLAAAWIASLLLVRELTQTRQSAEQCLSIALFAWLPLSVTQSLAEGHNDIVMTMLALWWLLLLLRARRTAPVVLMLSALCKYVTAPLLVVDALQVLRARPLGWRKLVMRYAPPAVLAVAVFVLFYRSPEFFDGVRVISQWHFLRPYDAVTGVESLIGLPLWPLGLCISAIFPVVAVCRCITLYRDGATEHVFKATIAILAAVCFTFVSHLWPWYLIWIVPFAALLPGWWLSRFVVGVALIVPFAVAIWWVAPVPHHMELTALAVYVAAVVWTLSTRWLARIGDSPRIGG